MRVENYNLPDFLMLTPGKSGTTSFYKYIKQYAQEHIYLPDQKELNFLAFRGIKSMENFSDTITDDEKYLSLYEDKENYICGDTSPVYFHFYKNTVKNIKELYGAKEKDLKYIVILRNPIDRLWSSYHMFANIWDDLPFEEAIKEEVIKKRLKNGRLYDIGGGGKAYFLNYIENTLLYPNLKYFFEHLNRENFRFYRFEDLFNNRVETFKDICFFLEVDDKWVDNIKDVTIKTGHTKKVRFSFIYNFFVKTNKIKDMLKTTTLYQKYKYSIQKIKERIIKSDFFYNEREELSLEMRKKLYEQYYKVDIENLEKLLNIDLSNWKY